MTGVYRYRSGTVPLLVSIPHDGCELAPGMEQRMTEAGLGLPDTDWHVAALYEFATELGAHVLTANYSRYVVDLNRPRDDEALYEDRVSTGLCPTRTFSGEDIYLPGEEPDAEEIAGRITGYWRPYHDRVRSLLDAMRKEAGYALLWDAHSICAEVPTLFEGTLPDLNVGTDDGRSCDAAIEAAVMHMAGASSYTSVLNGRFRGGFITRSYGAPERNVHALQLELAQRAYMDEATLQYDRERAERLALTIRSMLGTYLAVAEAASEHAPVG